jgi:hypothetical protein
MISFRPLLALLLALASSAAWAETVSWRLGRTIDVRVPISGDSQIHTRTVVFPQGAIANFQKFFNEEDLQVVTDRNTMTLQLNNPGFVGNIQVFDQNGNLFILKVMAADRASQVDEMLVIKSDDPAIAAQSSRVIDGDSAVTAMVAHMLGGRTRPDITGDVVATYDKDGKKTIGAIIYQDDYFSMTVVKSWQGPQVRGFACVIHVTSKKPIRLDFRRLWFPGVLAVHCPELVSYTSDPSIQATPDQVITLFYVAE